MKFLTQKIAKDFAMANNAVGFTELICPMCEKPFYYVRTDDTNQWEAYGLWLHTQCLNCKFVKNSSLGLRFKTFEHYI